MHPYAYLDRFGERFGEFPVGFLFWVGARSEHGSELDKESHEDNETDN